VVWDLGFGGMGYGGGFKCFLVSGFGSGISTGVPCSQVAGGIPERLAVPLADAREDARL